MRRPVLLAAVCALGLLAAQPASAARPFPDVIALPLGFAPEGIAVGRGSTFYAGSLSGGGIVTGDLRTGELRPLAPSNTPIAGLEVDARNRVWAAGTTTGQVRVYDGDSGELLATYQGGPGFVNDLVVTTDAVYATNSAAAELLVVPLGPGGALPPASAVERLGLTGEWRQVPGFNANGIEAWSGRLIVAHSVLATLFAVDPGTGEATEIELGEPLPNVDGITRLGSTLYAVQNRLNQIAVIDLDPSLASGTVSGVVTDSDFRVPTTVAVFGSGLYAVNAKFGTPPLGLPFEVVRAERT
jgi:hypothetical protein